MKMEEQLGGGDHAFNPSTRWADAGRISEFRGQPDLQSEYQEGQGYKRNPVSERKEGRMDGQVMVCMCTYMCVMGWVPGMVRTAFRSCFLSVSFGLVCLRYGFFVLPWLP